MRLSKIIFLIVLFSKLTLNIEGQTIVDSTLNRHYRLASKTLIINNKAYFLTHNHSESLHLSAYRSDGKLLFNKQTPGTGNPSIPFQSNLFITNDSQIGFFRMLPNCHTGPEGMQLNIFDTTGVLTSSVAYINNNTINPGLFEFIQAGQLTDGSYYSFSKKAICKYQNSGTLNFFKKYSDTTFFTSLNYNDTIIVSAKANLTGNKMIIKLDDSLNVISTYTTSSNYSKIIKRNADYFALNKQLTKFNSVFQPLISSQSIQSTINCDSITDFRIDNDTLYLCGISGQNHYYIRLNSNLQLISSYSLTLKEVTPIAISPFKNTVMSLLDLNITSYPRTLGMFIHKKTEIYQPKHDINVTNVSIANNTTPYFISNSLWGATFYFQLQYTLVNTGTTTINSFAEKLWLYRGNTCYWNFGYREFSNLNLSPNSSMIFTTNPISITCNPTFSYNFSNNYRIIADSPNGCIDNDGSNNFDSTSIPFANFTSIDYLERNQENLVELYPNPTQEKINLKLSDVIDLKIKKLIILNCLGMKILEFDEPNVSEGFDVSSLPPGSYIVELHGKQNLIQRKLIKN